MGETQALAAGMILHGNYVILGVLGRGGFGITYLAEDRALGIRLAVKEFFVSELCVRRPDGTVAVGMDTDSSRQIVERLRSKFFKEARNLALLNHPNIIRIHSAFEERGTAYYVMDYIEGQSLGAMVKQQGAMPLEQALRYVRLTGEALEYLHSEGVSHLDVKPANIMVRAADDMPVLIDFGLSKRYDTSGHQTSSTPLGASHGFAPFEQYSEGGVEDFSPQTDVYSLAATLYCLLSGRAPAPATALVNTDLEDIPQVPATVMAAIRKAMSPAKRDRQASVRRFVDELGRPPKKAKAAEPETVTVEVEIRRERDKRDDGGRIGCLLISIFVLVASGVAAFLLWLLH